MKKLSEYIISYLYYNLKYVACIHYFIIISLVGLIVGAATIILVIICIGTVLIILCLIKQRQNSGHMALHDMKLKCSCYVHETLFERQLNK